MTHVVEYEERLPARVEDVFRFFADPYNLERLTPAFLRFRVLSVSAPVLGPGVTIDYRLRLHGIPFRWRSAIDRWEPNRCFVDTQLRGPYRRWEHTHEFVPDAGGTVVRDRVRYALPLGGLGELVAGRLVARDVGAIFAFRHATLRTIFGGR